MANMTVWKGPNRKDPRAWPTEIKLRDVTPQRRVKVANLVKLLAKEAVAEVSDASLL